MIKKLLWLCLVTLVVVLLPQVSFAQLSLPDTVYSGYVDVSASDLFSEGTCCYAEDNFKQPQLIGTEIFDADQLLGETSSGTESYASASAFIDGGPSPRVGVDNVASTTSLFAASAGAKRVGTINIFDGDSGA